MSSFHFDLIKALGELPNLEKSGFNPHFKASFVPLESLLSAVRPILARHNLGLLQDSWTGEDLSIRTTLVHSSGEKLESSVLRFSIIDVKPQALGSLLSYARRYQLMTFLCLAGDSDLEEKQTGESGINKAVATAQALRSKKVKEAQDDDIL